MSTTDGARSFEQDGEARVVQIYPRVSQDTAAYCPLQVSSHDTARVVIHNAVVTLGLDSSRTYSLLEVREGGGEERPLDVGECPLERVLLWPAEVQKWHPQVKGYYFILQQRADKGGNQAETSKEEYDDLCNLPSVTEQSVVEALRQRFYKHKIYTYASNILFAINPNKFLPVYYNPKYVKMYENQPLGKLSPHIFAIADAAFRAMLNRQANQCIVISGESSSGKTESSSYLIHCLTALSQKNYSSRVQRTILGAGPVLEAFGNARTTDNNNSSRFGKFIQLNYLESGVIRGAVIDKYLLEKSRLVSRDKNERNYHVFYYLLMGASKDEQQEFHLLKPQDYLYLKQVFNVFSLYSALFDWIVLHINHGMMNRRDIEDSVPCLSIGVLDMFGFENLHTNSFEQLCINYTNEMLQCYINHNIFTLEQEGYVSEGIAWENIEFTDNSGCVQLFSAKPFGLFHLLDDESNLPQGADETLLDRLKQQHRDNPFFVSSPKTEPTFVIKHFAGGVKYHIKDFLKKNSEHMRPEVISLLRSSERSFLHHLAASSPQALFRWGVLRATIRILAMFKHLGRQRAELSKTVHVPLFFCFWTSVLHCLCLLCRKSKTGRQKQLIPTNLMNLHSLQHIVGLTAHSRTTKSIFHPHRTTKPLTVSTQFQVSLGKLNQTIEKAEPFFIFCIRSNAEKKELHFDEELVQKQIKYMGILQIVQMQKSGYSAKYTFEDFFAKFHILFPRGAAANPEQITELFERMALDKSTYQIGKTKVLLKQRERRQLQDAHNKEVIRHIIILQRWFRACLVRLHFLQKKDASLLIQVCPVSSWLLLQHSAQRLTSSVSLRTSLTKRELKRQNHVEVSPNRTQQKQEGRGSPPPLNRPLSLPLDTSVGRGDPDSPSKASSLQRYKAMEGIKEKAVKWKERKSEGEPADDSSPDVRQRKVFVSMPCDCAICVCLPSAVVLSSFTPASYHSSSGGRPTRNPTIRISRATRVQQWDTSLDREINDPNELRNLDEFLGNQVNDLRTRMKDLSPTESIFLTATMQFRDTIKGMYSVQPKIAYKDLMKGYHNKVNSLAGPKEKPEVSLVVNLFQSVLDGFIRREKKRGESEPTKATKTTKKRRKKDKCPDNPLDHLFSTYLVNIMQSCDLCGSYIWGMEKAYMCSACKLICHKKCLSKIITNCSTRCDDSLPGSLHFGVEVCVLTSKANPIPKVVELLLMHVEINGLYTEGIYRKSGSACRARELHQILETDPECANLENYPIHTITGLLKRWLRELPDPLMTFSLYSDFLHAVELPEKSDRIRAVYQKVDELPPANYNTLERLIFHLVRVAKEEEHNKMSSSSLAIVFAPCILRSPDSDDPFLGMRDVSKTTRCVEILISEQLRRYNEKMQNIQELEYAEALAVNQLKLKRQNTVRAQRKVATPSSTPHPPVLPESLPGFIKNSETCLYVVEQPSELNVPQRLPDETDERTLIERIKSIKQEKVDLACRLPDLEQEHSDDNLDSSSSMSTESLEDRLDSLDSEGQ
uniref:Unconventional myosin-IXb-like n=1 Tax=Salarias fasciatus TaxID=181472 RepID=A0A672IFM6_SALFA